ncbi:XRE family transcriptional regulator [Sorangium sp. So ce834]|uniref:XRE family transcriptional regulator n=1 Tax=Sorangium sp. So ce834 TaxID=3133321 RepID=UPI003F5D5B54
MTKLAEELDRRRRTFAKLATKSGVSVERLEALARGSEATLKELRALARALGLSVGDFAPTSPESSEGRVEMMFRGQLAAITSKRTASAAASRSEGHGLHAEVFARRIAKALTLLSGEKGQLDWLRAFRCQEPTYLDAEQNADLFRNLFFNGDNVSALASLPHLVTEHLGMLLFVLSGERVDGASAAVDGQAFIFVSPRTYLPRMLFTLAHEVGHFVARSGKGEDFVSLDPENSIGTFAGSAGKEESYCNAFASCLLLPRAGIGITLKMIREKMGIRGELGDIDLLLLARAYGVSFEVAAKRCEDLNLLPEGGARSLYEELKRKHGGPEKRAAELGLPEAVDIVFPTIPPRLLDAAVRRVRDGEVSIGAAAGFLNVGIGALMRANRPPIASA